jgi:hemoglobin
MRLLPVAALAFLSLAVAAPLRAAGESDDEQAARPRSLFERCGGVYTLARAVDDFVDALVVDPVIKANAAIRKALPPSRRAGFKYQLTSLLCQETGGPCRYEGRSMREAHSGLDISTREWNAMAALFKQSLVTAKVPAGERQELMNLLMTNKGDIVTTKDR